MRKAPTSTELYIGRTSELKLDDNLYLTVLEDWEIWARHWLVTGSNVYMDQDVHYSDQHANCDPIVCMGGTRWWS